MDQALLLEALRGFNEVLDEVYGQYLDTTTGFGEIVKMINQTQAQCAAVVPAGTDLDGLGFLFGVGDPNSPDHFVQHKTTRGDLKARNSVGGANSIRAAQFLIVLVYAFWDSRHRKQIADALGVQSRTVLVPVIGDLRLLRNDIVHCKGVLQPDTAQRLEVVRKFKPLDTIYFDNFEIHSLIQELRFALDRIAMDAGCPDPGFRTIYRVG